MPVLEAMACGVVPVYSEIPCLKEYAVGIPVKTSGLTTVTFNNKELKDLVISRHCTHTNPPPLITKN